MLEQIKSLLVQDQQLEQQLKDASNLAEAVDLIVSAGLTMGVSFVKEQVSEALQSMPWSVGAEELSEEDLLAVAGGRRPSDTKTVTGTIYCVTFCTTDTKPKC